jgi:glyoxylase-like metal-dependent hydrolase (beta-lactamase superfamily II)
MSFPARLPSSFLALAVVAALAACARTEAPPAAAEGAPPAPAAPVAASDDARPFMIGTLQAIALRDGVLEFPNDNQVFGIGHTPQEVAAVLGAADLPTDKLQLSVQPLLVRSGNQVLLFDTGAAANFGPTAGKLPASLAAAGIEPAGITDIFISHEHGDHVGGLVDAAGKLVFPNATIYLSAPEWDYLRGLDDQSAAAIGIGQRAAFIAAITPKVVAFAPGTDILPGVVKAVEIKGHTPGHSGYLIGAGNDTLLYVGDAAHHSIISVQKPEWPNGFDGDATTGAASRAAMLEQNANSGQRIYAVHFPYPGLGKFVKRAEGYVWSAE